MKDTLADINTLKRIGPSDAFRLAFTRSGLRVDELQKRMKWSKSLTRRVFSADKFFPSFQDLPRVCDVLGNTIILDWLQSQVGQFPQAGQAINCALLNKRMVAICARLGQAAQTAQEIMADNAISVKEKRAMVKELIRLADLALELTGDLSLAGDLSQTEKEEGPQ